MPLVEHGLHDATVDAGVIRHWWARWPTANIGIRTGVCFDVLDVDGDDGVEELGRLLRAAHGHDDEETLWLPEGPIAFTPRNGVHVYVAPTGLGSRTRFRPGLDWRGRGGYVIVPPSIGANGKPYRWWSIEDDAQLDAMQPTPGWLRDALERKQSTRQGGGRPTRYGLAALEHEAEAVTGAPQGCRNDTLNRAGHTLARLVPEHLDAHGIEMVLTGRGS